LFVSKRTILHAHHNYLDLFTPTIPSTEYKSQSSSLYSCTNLSWPKSFLITLTSNAYKLFFPHNVRPCLVNIQKKCFILFNLQWFGKQTRKIKFLNWIIKKIILLLLILIVDPIYICYYCSDELLIYFSVLKLLVVETSNHSCLQVTSFNSMGEGKAEALVSPTTEVNLIMIGMMKDNNSNLIGCRCYYSYEILATTGPVSSPSIHLL